MVYVEFTHRKFWNFKFLFPMSFYSSWHYTHPGRKNCTLQILNRCHFRSLTSFDPMISFAFILCCCALASPTRGGVTLPDVQNFAGARIFHPAFPNFIKQSISIDDANNLEVVRKLFSSSDIAPDFSGLPWKILPSLGISDKQDLWSKSQILDAYEKNRHQGHLVWWVHGVNIYISQQFLYSK